MNTCKNCKYYLTDGAAAKTTAAAIEHKGKIRRALVEHTDGVCIANPPIDGAWPSVGAVFPACRHWTKRG